MKLLVFSPYDPQGGGGIFQSVFARMLNDLFDPSQITYCHLASLDDNRRWHPRWMKYGRIFWRALAFRQALANSEVSILQGHYNPASWIVGLAAMRSNKPFIVIPHGDFPPQKQYLGLCRSYWLKTVCWQVIGKRLLAGAAKVVVGSELEAKQYTEAGIRREKLEIIPNPIIDAEGPETIPLSTGPSFALWLGRVSKEKGLDLLIETWNLLQQKGCGLHLRIVGTVGDARIYQQLLGNIRKYALEGQIEFSGWVDPPKRKSLILESRCLLLPSHLESFGRVVPEAIMLRTPVIVSNTTPWKEIEGLGCKWLERTPQLWATELERLAREKTKIYLDGGQCEEFMGQFRFERIKAQWARLFSGLKQYDSIDCNVG